MDKINITKSGKGYLIRISLTDICNYNCVFCRPPKNEDKDILTNEEIVQVVKYLNDKFKIKTIHFTGGEPLLRPEVNIIISECKKLVGNDVDIALTTNGALLLEKIDALKQAGLNRINISVHSLREDKYRMITNSKMDVGKIKRGIEVAIQKGVEVKFNSIVIRNYNFNDIYEIAEFCFENGIIPRFLELYLVGPIREWFNESDVVSHNEILAKMEMKYGKFESDLSHRGNGASRYYINKDGKVFGIVKNQTSNICVGCDRIRISVNGKIKCCTFEPIDIRQALRGKGNMEELLMKMEECFKIRGTEYIGKREHRIDYSFRWNINNK